MQSGRQLGPSKLKTLILAGTDPRDLDQVELAIVRNATFLSTALAALVSGTLMFLLRFAFVGAAGWVIGTTGVVSYLLSRRGWGYWGALLLLTVLNVAFVLIVAERGPGQLEVVHVLSISMPFTLFAPRRWRTIVAFVVVALVGVYAARLPWFPPPSLSSQEHAVVGRLVATVSICVAVAAQLWGFFVARNGALDQLREALADARGADEAKDAFLANISHEIRTPMNGVLGMLSLLRDCSLTGASRQRVETAYAASAALLPVVDRLLRPDRLDPTYTSGLHDTVESSPSYPLVGEAPEVREGPPRVLVVDDNMVNLKVAERMLRRLECEVTMASSGAEALECIERSSYDLVLMDIQMPQMDGLEVTERIRQREFIASRVRTLPIVALTAHAMAGDRERFLAAGLDDYLSKPVERDVLRELIERVCGRDALNPSPS